MYYSGLGASMPVNLIPGLPGYTYPGASNFLTDTSKYQALYTLPNTPIASSSSVAVPVRSIYDIPSTSYSSAKSGPDYSGLALIAAGAAIGYFAGGRSILMAVIGGALGGVFSLSTRKGERTGIFF